MRYYIYYIAKLLQEVLNKKVKIFQNVLNHIENEVFKFEYNESFDSDLLLILS